MFPFSLTPFPELITSRLLLRQLTDEDVKFIYQLRSNEDVNKFIGRPLAVSVQDALGFIKLINDNISKYKSLYWLIILKSENKPAGTITLWQFSVEENSAEIGYKLLPQYQGKGIMHEAVKKIISLISPKILLYLTMPNMYTSLPTIPFTERSGKRYRRPATAWWPI